MSRDKRFTDIRKWDKEWFRKLTPKLKLLWLYLCDRCQNSGVWEMDMELASFQIGFDYTKKDILELGTDRVQILSTNKVYIKKFIPFHQSKRLNPNLNIHKNIVKAVREYGLEIPDELKPLNDESEDVLKTNGVKVLKSNRVISVPLNSKDAITDKLKIFEEIFKDEQFVENLNRLHKGKNILEGWEECYLHHSVKPSAPFHVWEWKQKLNTWMTLKKRENNYKKKYGTKTEAVTDLLSKFNTRHSIFKPDEGESD